MLHHSDFADAAPVTPILPLSRSAAFVVSVAAALLFPRQPGKAKADHAGSFEARPAPKRVNTARVRSMPVKDGNGEQIHIGGNAR